MRKHTEHWYNTLNPSTTTCCLGVPGRALVVVMKQLLPPKPAELLTITRGWESIDEALLRMELTERAVTIAEELDDA